MKRQVLLFWIVCAIGFAGLLHMSIMGSRMMMGRTHRHHGLSSVESGFRDMANERISSR